jgi:2-dehydropantoate 2-reductase
MRVLMVGAGATGGYFGGRWLEAGGDVTFLVRARRAEQIKQNGLVIRSAAAGDARVHPPLVQAEALKPDYDLVVIALKAYDFEAALPSFAAVGPRATFLPILNGMRHLDALDARFGAERVLGGSCAIASTLDAEGNIVHMNGLHIFKFGERSGKNSARVQAIARALSPVKFDAQASSNILLEMWEKWTLLATLAGMTCLMRAPIGDIVAAPAGSRLLEQALDECAAVARAAGYAPRAEFLESTRRMLTERGSRLTSSMMRDLVQGHRIEADQIIGDLLHRAHALQVPAPLLEVIYCHLKAYETGAAGARS